MEDKNNYLKPETTSSFKSTWSHLIQVDSGQTSVIRILKMFYLQMVQTKLSLNKEG